MAEPEKKYDYGRDPREGGVGGILGSAIDLFVPLRREIIQPEKVEYEQIYDVVGEQYRKKVTPAVYGPEERSPSRLSPMETASSAVDLAKKVDQFLVDPAFRSEVVGKIGKGIGSLPGIISQVFDDYYRSAVNLGQTGETQFYDPEQKREVALNPLLPLEVGMTGGALFPVKGPGMVTGMFAGRKSATGDKDKLKMAEEMAQQGVDRTEIWQKTGYFRYQDREGKPISDWRYEISDQEARAIQRPDLITPTGRLKIIGGEEVKPRLGDLFEDRAVFEAYPGLKPAAAPLVEVTDIKDAVKKLQVSYGRGEISEPEFKKRYQELLAMNAKGPSAQPTTVQPTTIKRASDFKETGEYVVTLPDGTTERIFRDTEQFGTPYWYKVGENNVIGTTREEALATLESRMPKQASSKPYSKDLEKGQPIIERALADIPITKEKDDRYAGAFQPRADTMTSRYMPGQPIRATKLDSEYYRKYTYSKNVRMEIESRLQKIASELSKEGFEIHGPSNRRSGTFPTPEGEINKGFIGPGSQGHYISAEKFKESAQGFEKRLNPLQLKNDLLETHTPVIRLKNLPTSRYKADDLAKIRADIDAGGTGDASILFKDNPEAAKLFRDYEDTWKAAKRLNTEDIDNMDEFFKEIQLHEIQHAIQARERGQKSGKLKPLRMDADNPDWEGGSNVEEFSPYFFEKVLKDPDTNEKLKPEDIYKRTLGEAEARLTERRRNYSQTLRDRIPPWEDLDVPEYKLLRRGVDF